MRKLDRFILKAFAGPFVAILLVVVFILMMQFLWLYIDELVGKGLGIKVILEFLMWGCVTILPLAMPLATLLASMMTVGSMAENNELMAIKASGVSLGRVMTPLFVACGLISVVAFWVSDQMVPVAYNEIFTLREDISKTKDEIKIPRGTFYDGIEGYVLRVNDRNDDSGMMYGVMVYDHSAGKGNTAITLADSALMKMSKSKDYLTFTLYNGTNYSEDNTYKYRDTTRELQKINFLRQDLLIPLHNYTFEKSDSSRFGDQVKAMELERLVHDRDSLQNLADKVHEGHVMRLPASTNLIKWKQLDTSALDRHLPDFHPEGFMEWKDLHEEARAYDQAAEKAREFSVDLYSYNRDMYEYNFYLRRMNLEIFHKYAGALACLILFFIGAPLGALIRKGGLGSSAIVSALFFALYWVIDTSGSKLARDGAVDPMSGAFIAIYALLPIGAFLTWKAINDSPIFDSDKIKTAFRKAKRFIKGMFKKTRIVYMGTPEFAVAPLDALVKAGYNVVGVVTVADKPSGRGLKVNESAVKKYAVEHGIPVLQPVKLKDPEFLEALQAWKADMFVVVAFRMLPEVVWTMPKLGTFNLHAALLPQYRGAAPINWAVINGEQMTGVTTFKIDKEIDTGHIFLRQEHRIADTDTAGDVHDALMAIGTDLVLQTVEGIIEGSIEPRVQRSFIQGSEVLKPAPKLTRELCHIDWKDTTKHVYNLIRGLSPYPTAFTELVKDGSDPTQMKIFTAEKLSSEDMQDAFGVASAAPGTVLSDGKARLAIATLDGAIGILDLQLAGKKRMDVKSFLLGFRDPSAYKCTEGTSKAEIEITKA